MVSTMSNGEDLDELERRITLQEAHDEERSALLRVRIQYPEYTCSVSN